MAGPHMPARLDDESLGGLQEYDVAGRISLSEGNLAYSKAELIEYWNVQARAMGLVHVVTDHSHNLDCVVRVRIGLNEFTLLYSTGRFEDLPPSSAMPYVIMLYASDRVVPDGPTVSIFSTPDAVYDECRLCLEFLVTSVIGNGNSWSLASLARDFNILDIDLPNSGYGLLLSDAFSAGKIKYAYLDLFRCIEHKALRYAQDQFTQNFLNDPRGTSEEIVSAVKSEKVLYGKVIAGNSAVIAGASNVIENVKKNNLYLAAVINRIEGLPSEANAKSTQILYAVRNSIAHAKAGDLMVERFPDYEFALSQIVPYVEILALRFAGIELDAALT